MFYKNVEEIDLGPTTGFKYGRYRSVLNTLLFLSRSDIYLSLPKCLLSAFWTSKRLLFLADIKRNSIIDIE